MRVLITGGAGFVGANLGVSLAQRRPGWEVVALDNLKRRGSELNLPRLRDAEVAFVHGDVRSAADVLAIDPIDAIVECSAEPSALAGVGSPPDYLMHANLVGAYHCLELARRDGAQLVFLSTSRVYPFAPLNAVRYRETDTRFELSDEQDLAGTSAAGISERFPLAGARTLYGATKLAAELLIAEYVAAFEVRATVNRCGVIAGPWQMGKVDQGVFTYWILAHVLGRTLTYLGYGGSGKQVRDLLHVDDLVDLVELQLAQPDRWCGVTVNVGGGREVSLSLRETTALCQGITGRRVDVHSSEEERFGDVRIYVSDCTALYESADWRPSRTAREVLTDTCEWIVGHERALRGVLG